MGKKFAKIDETDEIDNETKLIMKRWEEGLDPVFSSKMGEVVYMYKTDETNRQVVVSEISKDWKCSLL